MIHFKKWDIGENAKFPDDKYKMEEDLVGNVTVVISDFGLAKKEVDMEHTQCGSPAYMAPEVLDGQLYD